MDAITLGQLSSGLTLILALVASVIAIVNYFQKAVEKTMDKDLKEIKEGVKNLSDELKEVRKDNAKNYVSSFLSDLDRGIKPTATELEIFDYNLKIYQDLGGNGFVARWVEEEKTAGRLSLEIGKEGEKKEKK